MNKLKNLKKVIHEQLLLERSVPTSTMEQIAKKHLGIKTLKTQNSDSLDFHDLAVWNIKRALKAAYNEGKKSASVEIPKVEDSE